MAIEASSIKIDKGNFKLNAPDGASFSYRRAGPWLYVRSAAGEDMFKAKGYDATKAALAKFINFESSQPALAV